MSDLISRQAVLDAVNDCGICIQKILDIPSAEPERRWIPVTESLPEDGERVLITHKGGVSFGWYNGNYWERGASTKHRVLQTDIAWMPLPEAWRGEDGKA